MFLKESNTNGCPMAGLGAGQLQAVTAPVVFGFVCLEESWGPWTAGTAQKVLYLCPGRRHLYSFQWMGNQSKNNRFVFSI